MKKLVLSAVFIFSLISLIAQDFEVSPLQLFYNAEPGESQTKFIHIKNHSSKQEAFVLSLSDVSLNNKGNRDYVDAGSMKYSLSDWISIAPSFFELQPNEDKEVAVTLQQPADEYGSKWGAIFVKTATEQTAFSADKTISAGINITGRIVVDVYQTPGNNKAYKATITNLMEMTNSLDSIRAFNALINNLSDIITPSVVTLIATNIETAEEITCSVSKFVLFPKSSRKVELNMDEKLPKGTYALAAILDYGSRTSLEGTQIVITVDK